MLHKIFFPLNKGALFCPPSSEPQFQVEVDEVFGKVDGVVETVFSRAGEAYPEVNGVSF